MKNWLIVIGTCLMLSGCGWASQVTAHIAGYTTVCVTETNVVYVQFPTGVAPLYNKDGTLVGCK